MPSFSQNVASPSAQSSPFDALWDTDPLLFDAGGVKGCPDGSGEVAQEDVGWWESEEVFGESAWESALSEEVESCRVCSV